MNLLKEDWFTEGIIDFEYKKYILLAYLKSVKKEFDKTLLYPFMSELVFHFHNLQQVKSNGELLFDSFPQRLKETDIKRLKFSYERIIKDDETMKYLQDLILFAIPRIDATLKEGKDLFDFVQENLEISTVGLVPLYNQEGYLMVNHDGEREVNLYRFTSTVFESTNEKYRGLTTVFIGKRERNLAWTYEKIKLELVKNYSDLPNPATYLIISKLGFPLEPTILPVAKRMLMKELAAA